MFRVIFEKTYSEKDQLYNQNITGMPVENTSGAQSNPQVIFSWNPTENGFVFYEWDIYQL